MPYIHITDIEAAINFWRARQPSSDGVNLPLPTRALAEVYARMVYDRALLLEVAAMGEAAYAAWLEWYASTPDTPCIAICSTSQGDELCKGCGRTFEEVQRWPGMDPVEKRETWAEKRWVGTRWV